MRALPLQAPNILTIYLQIAQYPILARQIRHRMREELYRRGVITPARLEQEVKEKAILSQQREGLVNPLVEEDARQWEERQEQIRDHLTDFYFAHNLPLELFHHIVEELLARRTARKSEVALSFNPELAPSELVLQQVEHYEALPAEQQPKVSHHWEESIVVLIKTMISDQLDYVHIAKAWFTAADFQFIQAQRVGSGKIGGKAGGMLLAWKILQQAAPQLAPRVILPQSYFVGADVFYDFLALNGLEYFDQKYKHADQIRAEYPQIQAAYVRGRFPEEIADQLRTVLNRVGHTPLIVRSSSLLEDSFGTSFAGKYASYFCANQGTLKENLRELTLAIRRIYASVYNPDVLLYRRRRGLLDYDERMAILLQEVQGQTYRHYFCPTLAGVAFSYSPIVWNPRLRREEGFVRLVLGLGTRAVERVAEDYPRLVMLSHPLQRPEISPEVIRQNSQRAIDLVNLEQNTFATLPVTDFLDSDYPPLRWVASVDRGDVIVPMFALGLEPSPEHLVVTFDNLLQQSDLVPLLKGVLSTLAHHYRVPVDVEFAVNVTPGSPQPQLTLHLLQCRPQSKLRGEFVPVMPVEVPLSDKFFLALRMVPQGQVNEVDYIVYVDPLAYGRLATRSQRREVARIVGWLNQALESHNFILIGPGRWGTSDLNLGIPVTYADICNTRALIELAVKQQGLAPEPSYGTHFFQDLVEAQIYPLALYPDEPGEFLNWSFLTEAKNVLASLVPRAAHYADCVKVIHVPAEREGHRLEILMDGERALAHFVQTRE
jgi:Pyruvate phosphate dikinase, AMP/ATP-binding domain